MNQEETLVNDENEMLAAFHRATLELRKEEVARFVMVELLGSFVDEDILSEIAFGESWMGAAIFAAGSFEPSVEEVARAIHSLPDKLSEKFGMSPETAEMVSVTAAYGLFGHVTP